MRRRIRRVREGGPGKRTGGNTGTAPGAYLTAGVHDDAQRTFQLALSCAEESEDWHVRAMALLAMGQQALWCGDPDTALTTLESGMIRADRLTPTERAILHVGRSEALAQLGQVQDAARAVGLADEEFSHAQPANEIYWTRYDAGQHTGDTGIALWEAAIHHGLFVAEARDRLSTAVTSRRPEHARGRVMDQIKLASLLMATGDPTEAAAIGEQALEAMRTIRSQRLAHDLRDLRRLAQPHKRVTAVADLLHHISSASLT